MEPRCPKCNEPLTKVEYPHGSMLNRDQWESMIAGNWFCKKCPGNDRGKSGLCYWWDHEVLIDKEQKK